MTEERTIKAGVEMTESLHAEVKAMAARRRIKMKEAVRQAFTVWLESSVHSVPEPKPLSTQVFPDPVLHSDNRQDVHEALDRLLESPKREHIVGLILHADGLVHHSRGSTDEPRSLSDAKRLLAEVEEISGDSKSSPELKPTLSSGKKSADKGGRKRSG